MSLLQRGVLGGIGIEVKPEIRLMYNRKGATIARGDVVQLDSAFSQAESNSIIFGDPATVWGNVVTVFGLRNGIYFLALEDVLDDRVGSFLLQGVAEFAGIVGAGAAPRGTFLGCVIGADTMTSTPTANTTNHGLLLQATTAGTRENVKVLFDGNFWGVGRS